MEKVTGREQSLVRNGTSAEKEAQGGIQRPLNKYMQLCKAQFLPLLGIHQTAIHMALEDPKFQEGRGGFANPLLGWMGLNPFSPLLRFPNRERESSADILLWYVWQG